jgi:hypothetical protein
MLRMCTHLEMGTLNSMDNVMQVMKDSSIAELRVCARQRRVPFAASQQAATAMHALQFTTPANRQACVSNSKAPKLL